MIRKVSNAKKAKSDINNFHRPGGGIGAMRNGRIQSIRATNKPYGKKELEADRLAGSVTTPDYSFAGSTFNAETGEVIIKMTNTKFNSKADQSYDLSLIHI